LAAAQQMLVGLILVALIVYRPEGLLPERKE
jgi:ABC-type branched-subunit amino acid transport system permease subunit